MEKFWTIEGAAKDKQSITSDWEFTGQKMIEGVVVHNISNVIKKDGVLTELYRSDWNVDEKPVDQVFQITLYPGTINAWHCHQYTSDRFFVSQGVLTVVFYDAREDSPSFGLINEFRIGEPRRALLTCPPGIFHGVHNHTDKTATIVNLVDRAYQYEDPDHWRLPPDSPKIPYEFKP